MKKALVLLIVFCLSTFTLNASAKSWKDITLYGGLGGISFVRNSTDGKCHTSVLATEMNESSINIKHQVQRYVGTSLSGTKGEGYTVVKTLNDGYEVNYDLGSGTANTRAFYYNISPGTTLKGNVYLNNGWA